jgi:hypothetical protein
MPALVDDADIKAIIDTQRDTTPFIATADLIVTEDLANAGLSQARLTQIELYLAAHFVCITEERGGVAAEKLGDASERYNAPATGKDIGGLATTRYGQQALALDTSGILKAKGKTTLSAQIQLVPGGIAEPNSVLSDNSQTIM